MVGDELAYVNFVVDVDGYAISQRVISSAVNAFDIDRTHLRAPGELCYKPAPCFERCGGLP
jgi:hypothetical protein